MSSRIRAASVDVPCWTCGRPITQSFDFPAVAKYFCGPKCEARYEPEKWDANDEAIARAEPPKTQSHAAKVHAAMVAKYGPP